MRGRAETRGLPALVLTLDPVAHAGICEHTDPCSRRKPEFSSFKASTKPSPPPRRSERGLYVVGYMIGYVCGPQQWAYIRVTGALAAAAVHPSLFTQPAASLIYLQQHLLFVERPHRRPTALIPARPPTTLALIQSSRRRTAAAPGGQEKVGDVSYIRVTLRCKTSCKKDKVCKGNSPHR